jgi:hypothetical protein
MALKMVPMTSELIDEGEMLEALNEEMTRAQRSIEMYRKKWGEEAGKAAIQVELKIKFVLLDTTEGFYRTEWSLDTKRPKRPKSKSTAIASEDESGNPALFVRSSGSESEDDPRQLKLATRDGRVVNPDTGVPSD